MIHFVTSLPSPPLEANAIYYVQKGVDEAEHYVADQNGDPFKVSTEDLVQAYIASLRGAANGYASLDGTSKIPAAQMPTGSSPSEISTALAAKANSADVYTQAQVDTIESGLQSQIGGKQDVLSNATDVAKIGDGTFDGDPLVVVKTTDW